MNYRYGGDYPGLGVDNQYVYVTTNMFRTRGVGVCGIFDIFKNCQIVILKKADIIAGIGTFTKVYTPDGMGSAFTLQPSTVLGCTSPGSVEYFGEVDYMNSNTTVRVWSLTDPFGAPTLSYSSVTTPDNGGGIDNAPQCATPKKLGTLPKLTEGNAFWSAGSLWFCHSAGGSSQRSMVYYYRIQTNGFGLTGGIPPTLLESAGIDGDSGVWTYLPSIGGNAIGDVCLVYAQSDSFTCPTIRFTVRPAGATCFETPRDLKVSPTFYAGTRWGDFASVSADPADNTFWITHEWSQGTSGDNWGTYWGRIEMTPYARTGS